MTSIAMEPIEPTKMFVLDNGGHSIKVAISDGKKFDQPPTSIYLSQFGDTIQRGIISCNWEEMERIWRHTFYEMMQIEPSEYLTLITESVFTPKLQRLNISEIMLNKFNVRGCHFILDAYLALINYGGDGVVVDFGYDSTRVSVFCCHYHLPHATRFLDVGGKHLTMMVHDAVNPESKTTGGGTNGLTNGSSNATNATNETDKRNEILLASEQIKEKHCYVASDYEAEIKVATTMDMAADSVNENGISAAESIRIPEVLFNVQSSEFSESSKGGDMELKDTMVRTTIQATIFDAVNAVDDSLIEDCVSNIILVGNGAKFRGIEVRLKNELQKLWRDKKEKSGSYSGEEISEMIKIHNNKELNLITVGGLGMLSECKNVSPFAFWGRQMIVKGQIEEHGPGVVFDICNHHPNSSKKYARSSPPKSDYIYMEKQNTKS